MSPGRNGRPGSARALAAAGLLVLASLSPAPGAAGRDSPVLATVNGERITLDDLKRGFEARHGGHKNILGGEPALREFLASAIGRRLFIQEARRLRLEEDPEIAAAAAAARERALLDWLYRIEVSDRVQVDAAAVDRALEARRSARDVILVQTDTREQARAATERLRAQADAEAVARDLSTARSRTRGGLERILWGTRGAAIEEAILSTAPGEVTEPVPVEEGWAVAKVVEIVPTEAAAKATPRDAVEGILKRRRLDARRAEYLDGLRSRYDASVREDLLDPEILLPLVRSADAADDRLVARFRGGGIPLSQFASTIRDEAFEALRPGRQRLEASRLVSDRLDTELLRLEAARRAGEAPKAVLAKARDAEDDLIYDKLLADVTLRGTEVTDEEVREWYESHRETFVEPLAIRLAVALLDTEAQARDLIEAARAGEPFDALARERSKDPATAARGGIAGWVTRDQAIPELRPRAFDLEAGAIGGPVEIEGGWLVYRVLERREPEPIPLDRARDRIRAERERAKALERMKTWDGKLRAAATIRMHEGGIRKAARILDAEAAARLRSTEGRAAETEGEGDGRRP